MSINDVTTSTSWQDTELFRKNSVRVLHVSYSEDKEKDKRCHCCIRLTGIPQRLEAVRTIMKMIGTHDTKNYKHSIHKTTNSSEWCTLSSYACCHGSLHPVV